MEEPTRRTHLRPAQPAVAVAEATSQPLLMLDNNDRAANRASNRATDREPTLGFEKRHKITNREAAVHLVKSTIGGGFLAMPEAFSHAGIIVGSLGTCLIGIAVLNMMSSIVRISQALRSGKHAAAELAERNKNNGNVDDVDTEIGNRHGNRELILPPMDYPETVAAVFKRGAGGRFARWAPFAKDFTSTALVATYYGVNIIYVCIVAETLKQLVNEVTTVLNAEIWWAKSLSNLSIRWYPTIAALLIIPVGMVRLMKYLVPFSLIANTCLVGGAVLIVCYILFSNDVSETLNPVEKPVYVVWPWSEWTLFAGSALCSMEGVGMLLHIENVMENPLGLAGPPSYTLHVSMLMIILANGFMGLFGYIKYGTKCKGSISLNLPLLNVFTSSIKGVIASGILLTYGLQLTVTADLTWKKFINTTFGKRLDIARQRSYYYTMRMLLIFGSIIIATAVPDIGPLVSLVGSVGFSVLGLIIPIIMETVWYWDQKDYEDAGGAAEDEGLVGMHVIVTEGIRRNVSRIHRIKRFLRHVKNTALLLLAVSSLAGGAYFNITNILTKKNNSGTDDPSPW